MVTEAPVVETERLVLRAHRLDDFPAFAAIWADPIVVKHIGGKPSTEQASWMRMLRYPGHWSLVGFGFWALEEKASKRLAGEVGFMRFKREIEPSIGDTPEAGWVLAPWAHGKGYATEAVKAALAWKDAKLGGKTVCLIDAANVGSFRVAEKCGFRRWVETSIEGTPAQLFER
jgi:RimJ/RimL family protein N-acetyltransferase